MRAIVNKYSEKQEERDIINQEEVFVKSIYRDLMDSDIFNDFQLLYQDDFYIIDKLQNTKEGSPQSFHAALTDIVNYLRNEDNKKKIKDVCGKYGKGDKFDWIFRNAVNKINKYIPQLSPDEVIQARKTILSLVTAILE